MAGRYFDEWATGDRILHRKRHAVVETDDIEIKSISHLIQPLFDADHEGQGTERTAVNKTFVLAVTIGIPVTEMSLAATISKSEYDKLMMPKPVFVGDVLTVETEVVEMHRSKSRTDAGIITFKHATKNRNGDIVCQCWHKTELWIRPQPRDDIGARIPLPDFLKRAGARPPSEPKTSGI